MTNRLAEERSPYLRSAAHQPVDWWPWGPEAFAEAKRLDRPILLDVGAVWCHWCHVMDAESYEDPATAALLNERFVAIKVDRDERPDVDVRYQKAVQALTGQGGWPLTAFLLPDGRCFYGGTYFPPDERYGRPSFRRVLAAIADLHAKERDKALHHAEHVASAFVPRAARAGEAGEDALRAGENAVLAAYDPVNGGFGNAPKFPHPGAVAFALRRAARRDAPRLADVATHTLRAMIDGGVHDQIQGGFHRYSVDERWHVPHFEKMLSDNAELLRNCVHAFQATGDDAFARAARGILAFFDDVLWTGEGLGASQDADVGPSDDGSHFTWTAAEVEAALGHEDARLARERWTIDPSGDFHGRNVLAVAADAEALAAAHQVPSDAIKRRLEDLRVRLLDARRKRQAPFVDPTVYTNWNAMAASAMLEAAAALGIPRARERALRILGGLVAAVDPAKGAPHRVGSGRADGFGLLDDNAHLAWACTEAFVHTQEPRWLDAARGLLATIRRDFAHPRGGRSDTAAWLRAGAIGPLAEPERSVADHGGPNANAVAAMAHLRVALLTGDEAERAAAKAVLDAFADEARRFGFFAGTYLLALDLLLDPPPHVTVLAAPGDAAGDALAAAALAAYAPGKAVVRVARGAPPEGLPAEVRGMLAAAPTRAAAFVCRGTACEAPASDADVVRRSVGKG